MHRPEDETLEGNYATDFSPYATRKVSKHQQRHASLQTQAFSVSFPVSSDHHEEFGKARQTFHVPFESLVSKEHSAEVMLALHQTSSAVLARPTLFFLCAEKLPRLRWTLKSRAVRKSRLSLSWTKSSIILSRRNIRFCKVIWLINLCKFNKQTTVAITAILRLLGLILISTSSLKWIVTTSPHLWC